MKPDDVFRFDETKGVWIVSASKRAKRPFVKKKSECPFCRGCEAMTPPTIFALPNCTKWRTRCFENAFPIVKGKHGRHEVIVETPNHDELFQNLGKKQLELVFESYRNRFNALSKKTRCVFLFKNHGPLAGASIPHEHAQIMGVPFVPELLCREYGFYADYKKKKRGECFYCSLLKGEGKKNKLFENRSATAFVPFFARFPYEIWVLTKKHARDFNGLSEEEGVLFLQAVQESVKRFQKISTDYIIAFHQASGGARHFHFHAEIYPRKSVWAGAELGAGIIINSRDEKQALAELRARA